MSTKFADLQAAYNHYREERKAYNDSSYEFAAALMRNFVTLLEFPDKSVKWYPPSKGFDARVDPRERTVYTQVGAMEMGDDGFWRLGLAASLSPARVVILYVIEFKKINDKFIVRLEHFDNEFEIGSLEPDGLRGFIDFMAGVALNSYQNGFKDFIQQKNTRKHIGFISVSSDS